MSKNTLWTTKNQLSVESSPSGWVVRLGDCACVIQRSKDGHLLIGIETRINEDPNICVEVTPTGDGFVLVSDEAEDSVVRFDGPECSPSQVH